MHLYARVRKVAKNRLPKEFIEGNFFPAPGLCSLFARAKIIYRRLVDEVVEIFVLLVLHNSFFFVVRTSAHVKLRAFLW